MTNRPGGSKWVGNAGLIIGLPWDKRKSLPRNSKGFEPVEGYFDRTTSTESSDSDDSSETDTEELVRQEREIRKKIEAEARRKAVEEARSNADYLMRLVAQEKEAKAQQQQREREEAERWEEERKEQEREAQRRREEEKRQREKEAQRKEEERRQREKEAQRKEEERRQKEKEEERQREKEIRRREEEIRQRDHTQAQSDVSDKGEVIEEIDVGSNMEVFALPKTSRQENTSEGMYSPEISVVVQGSPSSVMKKSTRLLPSRLSFSGGDIEESSSDAERTNTKKKPRQEHRKSSKSAKKLESTFLSASPTTDTVSLMNDDALIQQADHILATTESSFRPGKTSTQLKSLPLKKSGTKKEKSSKRLPSAIVAVDRLQFSESESERDDTLEVLLADDAEHFQGLKSHLAKSKVADVSDSQSTTISDGSAKAQTIVVEEKSKPRQFAKKSTGNMAGKLTQKSKPRKSVTFAAGSSSEVETEGEYQDKRRTTEAPPTALDNIYMSFDDDNFDTFKSLSKKPGKAKKPKKSRKPPPSSEMQSGRSTQGDTESEDTTLVDSHEHSSGLTDDAKSMLSAVNDTRKSTTSSVEGEAPANRPKDRRARVSETPEHDSESSPKNILKNVSLLLNKPPPQQAQWFVPGMDLYRKRKSKSSASSMLVTAADSAELNMSGIVMESNSKKLKKGRPRKSTATENETGSKSEAKHWGRGTSSKYVAPPLSPDEAPPTHTTTTLVSSESEMEDRDLNQEPAKVAESSKGKKGHPHKSTLKLKQSTINLASSESEFEGEVVHNKVEESSKRKRGRQHKSSTLVHDATLTSRVEVEVPPEEHEADELQETVTVESPKKKRGRRQKPTQEATSSESELDDWLETVQENQDGRESRKSGPASQEKKKSLQANESKLEKIVEGLQKKTLEGKRGRGRPRKIVGVEQSVSSRSEMEGGKTAQQSHVELVQRGELEQSKRGRGRPRKIISVEQSASSGSEMEGGKTAQQSHVESVQRGEMEQSKRGRGRPRKIISVEQSASSGSEMEGGKTAQQSHVELVQRGEMEQSKRGRGRPRKTKGTEQSASSGSEMEGEKITHKSHIESLQRGEMEQSKRGRGRPRKVKPTEPVSSESDVEEKEGHSKSETESENERQDSLEIVSGLVSADESEGEHSAESAHLEHKLPLKKSEAKRGKGRSRKSAAPPASESGESEMDKIAKHRDTHPAPADGLVPGEGGMSQKQKKKKKKSKNTRTTQEETVENERQPVVEIGDEPQFVYDYDNIDNGDDDYDSPLSPTGMYDDHADGMGSRVTNNVVPPATTPGSAGSRGGEQAADLSGAQSIDVSVLPRLIKRKRARGNRVVVAPRSKKRKQTQMLAGTVQDLTLATPQGGGRVVVDDTYSMSTSGEEGEESDHFDGAEIIQSGGGRRYRRLRVEPKKSHTPGVRRSKRTRVAPVRHWENEQLEYDLNTSGAVLKGLLVPVEQEHQGPSRQKRPNTAIISERQLGPQEDDAFSPYRVTDDMGNTSEMAIVRTLASASRMSCSGEPVTEDSDAEVIIHKLHSSPGTANGVMTFAALGEKPRSSAKQFDMFFYVLKGKLLFQVDNQEFVLMPSSSINIPEGCIYCIRNTQHTRAEVYFYTHYTGNVPQ